MFWWFLRTNETYAFLPRLGGVGSPGVSSRRFWSSREALHAALASRAWQHGCALTTILHSLPVSQAGQVRKLVPFCPLCRALLRKTGALGTGMAFWCFHSGLAHIGSLSQWSLLEVECGQECYFTIKYFQDSSPFLIELEKIAWCLLSQLPSCVALRLKKWQLTVATCRQFFYPQLKLKCSFQMLNLDSVDNS